MFVLAAVIICIVFGITFWRKEASFYRVFAPLALGVMIIGWSILIIFSAEVRNTLLSSVTSGHATYIYITSFTMLMTTALFTAIYDAAKAEAPEKLPLSDTNLCSLVMNIMDNAVKAAAESGHGSPYIHLDIHVKNDYFALTVENSANMNKPSSLGCDTVWNAHLIKKLFGHADNPGKLLAVVITRSNINHPACRHNPPSPH